MCPLMAFNGSLTALGQGTSRSVPFRPVPSRSVPFHHVPHGESVTAAESAPATGSGRWEPHQRRRPGGSKDICLH